MSYPTSWNRDPERLMVVMRAGDRVDRVAATRALHGLVVERLAEHDAQHSAIAPARTPPATRHFGTWLVERISR